MEVPILLTKKELVHPINQALKRIEAIRQLKAEYENSLILEGLFVLAVSTFENSLNDTLRVILKRIPGKLDIKSETLPKDLIISGDTLSYAIDNKVNNISYKNIEEVLKCFVRITSIDNNTLLDPNIDTLKEIKASRNLLIHNDLIVNSIYKETAGNKPRSPRSKGNRLSIDQEYLFRSIIILKDFLGSILEKLESTYNSYTYLNAINRLFKYLFPTPIMVFENEFKVDKESDNIIAYNSGQSRINDLSSSERFFFEIWLSHFTGKAYKHHSGALYSLDDQRKKQLHFFIDVVEMLKT